MAKKILVVDDEFNIVKTIVSRLKANNYDIAAAYDGIQAVQKAHEEKPDLIILDIRMPAGSGVTVYENLQMDVVTSFIPVIFITAYDDENTRKKVMEMGAADFIVKPFEAEELLSKIKKVFGEQNE